MTNPIGLTDKQREIIERASLRADRRLVPGRNKIAANIWFLQLAKMEMRGLAVRRIGRKGFGWYLTFKAIELLKLMRQHDEIEARAARDIEVQQAKAWARERGGYGASAGNAGAGRSADVAAEPDAGRA